MNYYRLHIGDYLRDAAHLSLLEHGVYTRLMQVYYAREQGIGDTEKYRVIGARTDEERAAVDAVLDQFFVLAEGAWNQSRCEREIEAYRSKAERNREVGRLGGRPVKSKNPEETQTVSIANPTETLANSQEPIASKKQEEERARSRTPAPRGARIPDGFPTEAEFAWCAQHRPELDAVRVGQVFRDYHTAHGSTMKDWPAAWRTWVGKERPPPGLVARRSAAADERHAYLSGRNGQRPQPTNDPRTIDVDAFESFTPRLAAGGG